MYARLFTVPVKAGKLDDFDHVVGEQGRSTAEGSKGYRGGDVLIDHQNNVGGVLTFWETREDAEAFGASSGRQSIMSAMSDIAAGEPRIEMYEVTTHDPPT